MRFHLLFQCRVESLQLPYRRITNFVPQHELASQKQLDFLQDYLKQHKNILVITGAGVSTESGIPDYRSEGVGLYSTSPNRPVQFQNFMSNEDARKKYWLRNYVAWPRFSSFQPNVTHTTLARWQRENRIGHIVTQNVDRLHFKAGSENVTDLHGTNYRVKCMTCGHKVSRFSFQQTLAALNPIKITNVTSIRPDGDVDLDKIEVEDFRIPNCERCNGILKPDVVMFGETVPTSRISYIYSQVEQSDALLVLGSSLMVYSAYRFILEAAETLKPVVVINIGPTRADNRATLKISTRCGDILSRMQL